MNDKLLEFLETLKKTELKYMHSLEVDDPAFGVETDRFSWCKKVLENRCSIDDMIAYFEKYYPNDEKPFVLKLKELVNQ